MSKTTLHSTYPQRTSLRMKIIYLFVCFDDQKLAEAGVRFDLEVGPATQSRWIIITWTSMWKLYVDKPIHPQAESQSTIWRSNPTTRTERQLAPLHQIRSSLFFWIWLFCWFWGCFDYCMYGPTCTSKVDGACMFIMLDCHSARSFFCSWTTIQFVCSVLPTSEENHQGYQWVYHSLPFQMLLATRFQCSINYVSSLIHFDRVLDWTDLDLGQYVLSALSLSWMGSYGHSSAKPSAVWGSMPCPQF